ncbi:MAG: sensor histidine kinase [Bacteroidetes bacterium]|nr:sensor histidine kinase [Bacteroidota bacterium]
MEFYQKREARIVNLFALITLLGLVLGITTVFFITGNYPTPVVLFTAMSSLSILFFNWQKKYNTATYIFVICINFCIFILNEQYDISVGNYLYYFPVVFCVALLHNPTKTNTRTIIFFIIILLGFVAAMTFNIDSLKLANITEADNRILLMYNCGLTVSLTILLVYLVVKLINRQNNEAIALLHKEQEAQLKISQSLKEKDVLLAEIQHRVKNNLAVITGLLNLQTEKAPCNTSKQLMIESRNRVMSISMVHERLYKKDNLSKIDFKIYVSELVKEVITSFSNATGSIKIEEELDKVEMEITKAVPIGLIINEALTNSLKHAFQHHPENPTIYIRMQIIYDRIQISVSDNGIGFSDIEKRSDTSLGISLIESLADQIDAKVVFRNEPGACVSLVFPFN